jgi:excisionase family DNA binding protein
MRNKHARVDEFMSVGEVADAFGVHRDTVKRWEKAGRISPAIRIPSGHRRYHRSDIDARLASAAASERSAS